MTTITEMAEDHLAHLAANVERTRLAYQAAKETLRVAQREQRARRICCHCRKPISNHHKWSHVLLDEHTALAHRNCTNPGRYK